ncbi:hypothetical protein U3516DRAFT_809373 [Neocallimastix sp. 'constans']
MKENIRIKISETNREKKQIIIIRKYTFNFSNEKKDNSKIYKCTEYRTSNKLTIRESPFSLDIRPKRIFNEISQDMGLICPEFNTIRTQIIRSQNKQLRPGITAFEEIPGESEYYKIENDIFTDGTFYIAPKFSYQVFITRTYVEKINSIYTTSISILKDKKQSTYETLFKEIKKKKKTQPHFEKCTIKKYTFSK